MSCADVERVTGIEPALSAWEDDGTDHVMPAELHVHLSVSDRNWPLFTTVNGPAKLDPVPGRCRYGTQLGRS